MAKKKAKFKTRYVEPVYPSEFRVRRNRKLWCPVLYPDSIEVAMPHSPWMPVMLTGWVQGEVHVQWGFQSMQ